MPYVNFFNANKIKKNYFVQLLNRYLCKYCRIVNTLNSCRKLYRFINGFHDNCAIMTTWDIIAIAQSMWFASSLLDTTYKTTLHTFISYKSLRIGHPYVESCENINNLLRTSGENRQDRKTFTTNFRQTLPTILSKLCTHGNVIANYKYCNARSSNSRWCAT